jgi:hypothetical protein
MEETRLDINVTGQKAVPATVPLDPTWGPNFEHAHSVVLELQPKTHAYLFLHRKLQSEDPKEVQEILRNDSTVGYVLSFKDQVWTIKTEATSEGTFGLVGYTKSGKPYLAGEGTYDSSGRWSAKFATLYPGIRNKIKCTVQGGARGGTGQKTETQVSGTLQGTW